MVRTISKSGLFSSRSDWEAMSQVRPVVPRSEVVLFKHRIPRWAIIHWISILSRIATKGKRRIVANIERVPRTSGVESHNICSLDAVIH